ncbi:MAG: DNA recombination protein RmuC, partial [Burkholderiales bacterium]
MSEWILWGLGGLNLLLLLVLLHSFKTLPDTAAAKAAEQASSQMGWQQQQFDAVQARTERLERELRNEISQSGVQGRQEVMQTLTLFQQSLLQQSAEAARTQNQQIDVLAQQLA